MKKILYFFIALPFLILLNLPAFAETTLPALSPEDTVTIQIGKNKKIIIWVKDKKELESLQAYDINQMIADLGKTVDSLENPDHVLIITDENRTRYKIEVSVDVDTPQDSTSRDWFKAESDTTDENEGRRGIHFNHSSKKEKNPFRTSHHFEFDLGMNNYLNGNNEFPGADNEQYTVRPWGSWFVGINSNFRSRIAGPVAVQWGGGISWYNFKFEDDRTRIERTPDGLDFTQADNDIYSLKSKLTASYLNVNVVPMLDFRYKSKRTTDSDGTKRRTRHYKDDAFRIGLGGYAGYRIGSHAKYKFDDGKARKEKDNDSFYLNNWRYGVRFQVGIKGLDLFANYDLNDLFHTGRGPELHALSFGITL